MEDAQAKAELDEIRTHTLAAVGALLSGRPEVVPGLLVSIQSDYGRAGVAHALHVLCSTVVDPARHQCHPLNGTVKLLLTQPAGFAEWPESCALAEELLSATMASNGVRLAAALSQVTTVNSVQVLHLLAQHTVAVIESVQDTTGQAFEAFDELVPVPNRIN